VGDVIYLDRIKVYNSLEENLLEREKIRERIKILLQISGTYYGNVSLISLRWMTI
jgi:hypothetical protein